MAPFHRAQLPFDVFSSFGRGKPHGLTLFSAFATTTTTTLQKVTKGQWSSPSGNDAHAAWLQIIYQVRGGSFGSVHWAARDLALHGKRGVD